MTIEEAQKRMDTDAKFQSFVEIYCMMQMHDTRENIDLDTILPELVNVYDSLK